jgi:hypothetical protein
VRPANKPTALVFDLPSLVIGTMFCAVGVWLTADVVGLSTPPAVLLFPAIGLIATLVAVGLPLLSGHRSRRQR